MTVEADLMRDRRRAIAAPGGSLDRIVRWLAVGLPAAVGVVTALMIITPLGPRGEVSFLLDRNKVALADDRLRVDNAIYRGEDKDGRPFSLSAGEAVQKGMSEPIVRMHDLTARILLPQGPAVLSASAGRYDFDAETVAIDSELSFRAADGYTMTARGVAIDLNSKTLVGSDGVEGTVPAGTFSANALQANLADRTVALVGNARLRMIPNRLKMPQ
ncbi:LPS export ABC transporter periplasmic protein LptC [Altererythrobacter salegens]|uniref:LPS export ABC transporter periplasmic protein LptC n=1 Tax=Croceibacterium salegens TaxID=1737568 RepID=A0A6I4SXJ9_9SPHN|nr:LPS export ABC transporter periplasmic protein LptC [Croceibacterium salegens]MXO60745.1 LPS export ABC transporter periplasmic protein LptC [Croceibacterium salegens]